MMCNWIKDRIFRLPENTIVFGLLLVIYGIMLMPFINGIGGYWDWSFPYFTEQLPNFFTSSSMSWNDADLGAPLGYLTSYVFAACFMIFSIVKIAPEVVLWLLILGTFVFGSYGVYRIVRTWLSVSVSVLFGLLVMVNPAIFYKMMAGHLSYLISFTIFIYLVGLVLKLERWRVREAVVLGLLLAFVGTQIQFILIAALLLGLHFILNQDKFSIRHFTLALLIAFAINLPWMINFIVGANSIGQSSVNAAVDAFRDSSHASIVRIALFLFSGSTLIHYFFPKVAFVFFGLLSLAVFGSSVYYWWSKRKPEKPFFFLVFFLILLVFLGTGAFHDWEVPWIKTIYPMFREIGHLAPVIVLFEILVLAYTIPIVINRLNKGRVLAWIGIIYLALFFVVNARAMILYVPRLNFANVRNQFEVFREFDQSDQGSYSVLNYPFFNQYGFLNIKTKSIQERLINNAGWDGFSTFANHESLSNYATEANFKDLLQYRLLLSNDISELEKKNVKYIYDFSGIYESNFDRYTDPVVYDYNSALIKNDPQFFARLQAQNPDRITRVGSGIYQLENAVPRAYGNNLSFQRINSTKYRLLIRGLVNTQELTLARAFHPEWKLFPSPGGLTGECSVLEYHEMYNTTECVSRNVAMEGDELAYLNSKPLFEQSHQMVDGYANRWTIDAQTVRSLPEGYYKENTDGSLDVALVLYFQPQSYFYVAVAMSVLTLIGTIGYLIIVYLQKGKIDERTL